MIEIYGTDNCVFVIELKNYCICTRRSIPILM